MLKAILVVSLMLCSALPLMAQSHSSPAWRAGGSLEQSISQLGQEYLQRESGVGLSIGIVDNGRTHIYHFGTTEKNADRPPTDQTVYEVGSIAKTFAGLLLARAVLDGKIELDGSIDRYVNDEYPNLACDGEPVRIVHLANMTSGLPNTVLDHAGSLSSENQDASAKDKFLQALHAVKVTEKPGINPTHSNAAADLLRYILENAYGDAGDVLVHRLIEKPYSMQDGGATDRPRPKGYDSQGEEVPADAGPRYSILDMLQYSAHQLDESDEAVALSHRSTWDTLDGQQSIGFFWITSKVEGGRSLRYSGGTSGFSSFCGLYPERKLGIVLLANNASETAQDQLQNISERIAAAIRDALLQR